MTDKLERVEKTRPNPTPVFIKGGAPFWFRIIEAFAITVAISALWVSVNDNRLSHKALEEQRLAFTEESIFRAWSVLGTVYPGNSGKISALEYLFEKDTNLYGVDLSCSRMGGNWVDKYSTCDSKTYLDNLDLSATESENYRLIAGNVELKKWSKSVNLRRANFSGTSLKNANLRGAMLWESNFSGAMIAFSDFSETHALDSNFSFAIADSSKMNNAFLKNANFSNSDLFTASFASSDLNGSNFSGANLNSTRFNDARIGNVNFCNDKGICAKNLTSHQVRSAWAFADEWDGAKLPPYLKIGPQHEWPTPVLCQVGTEDWKIRNNLMWISSTTAAPRPLTKPSSC